MRRVTGVVLAMVGLPMLGFGSFAPAAANTGAAPLPCAWELRLDPNVVNFFYPDQAANYWITELPAAPGETLTINGMYPHARYISLISYDGVFRAVDGLNDQHIQADPGSTNPFLLRAKRDASARSFSVSAVFGQRPPVTDTAHQDNYLYTTSQDGSHTN